jgi:hypothetical protein
VIAVSRTLAKNAQWVKRFVLFLGKRHPAEAKEPADMCQSFDALAAFFSGSLGLDPLAGTVISGEWDYTRATQRPPSDQGKFRRQAGFVKLPMPRLSISVSEGSEAGCRRAVS